ncbi:hypothetical protein NM208_g11183 [Fusarium decemcellulare]|uniref:Uncharacterized protein n=1 Tax=Fusarium decemcellulare TaxID=57161 RepID=A0ACC1RVA9_9HYPO|nr:hypothetical protein NM208_g11183 [Fusarium decemcellulare]
MASNVADQNASQLDSNVSTDDQASRENNVLTVSQLLEGIEDSEEARKLQQMRHESACNIVAAFDEVKTIMGPRCVQELYNYLKSGKWIPDKDSAYWHRSYFRLTGKGGLCSRDDWLYYPDFFILQAMYPDESVTHQLRKDLSQHWHIEPQSKEPFFPKLDNPELEYDLFLGYKLDYHEFDKQLDDITKGINERLADLQRDATKTIKESERRLPAVRESAETVRDHLSNALDAMNALIDLLREDTRPPPAPRRTTQLRQSLPSSASWGEESESRDKIVAGDKSEAYAN